ncbi:MAG: hypothetical protein F6K30_08510 [Cyanothece sp. SIO2G6]|nr:hypothetical protein [Cyanothece sp. SIO2G6]
MSLAELGDEIGMGRAPVPYDTGATTGGWSLPQLVTTGGWQITMVIPASNRYHSDTMKSLGHID